MRRAAVFVAGALAPVALLFIAALFPEFVLLVAAGCILAAVGLMAVWIYDDWQKHR